MISEQIEKHSFAPRMSFIAKNTEPFFRAGFSSPVGQLFLLSDGDALTGLYIDGQKHFPHSVIHKMREDSSLPVLRSSIRWLELYFSGRHVSPSEIPLNPSGSSFQLLIWRLLCSIPYGETITYGQIAKQAAAMLNKECIAPQAVGGAVGRNPISIIIPCHRVLGANGSLTGYAGGTGKKAYLLALEKNPSQVSPLPALSLKGTGKTIVDNAQF